MNSKSSPVLTPKTKFSALKAEGLRMERFCRLLLSVCFVAALTGRDAVACECGQTSDVKSALGTAHAFFRGEVEEVHDRLGVGRRTWYRIKGWFSDQPWALDSATYHSCCGLEVVVQVTGSWKGIVGERQRVLTGRGEGDCGFHFQPGVEYLIYARRLPSGDLVTDICTRTRQITGAREDLAILDGASTDP